MLALRKDSRREAAAGELVMERGPVGEGPTGKGAKAEEVCKGGVAKGGR